MASENKTHIISLNSDSRACLRAAVLGMCIHEAGGSEKGTVSYRWNVEHLRDGDWVYVKRYGIKYKCHDLVVGCDNYELLSEKGYPRRPGIGDVTDEIESLSGDNKDYERELVAALRRVWNCENPNVVVADLVHFKTEMRAERLLKVAKWLFIEQDIAYWHYRGRNRPWDHVLEVFPETLAS